MFAVESKNIVGYNTLPMEEGVTFKAFGPSAMTVGADGTFTLKDTFKVGDGYDSGVDHFFIINPETADADYELCYYNEIEAAKIGGAGWYDYNFLDPFNDVEFDLGTGFETSASGNALEYTTAGEVCKEGYAIDGTGICFMMAVNGTSRPLKWSEISVAGEYDSGVDHFFMINAETADADYELCYYNEQEAAKIGGAGWYDYNFLDPFNEETLNVGEGVETSFGGGETFLVFPGLDD